MNPSNASRPAWILRAALCLGALAAASATALADEAWHPKPQPRELSGPIEIDVQVINTSAPKTRPLAVSNRIKGLAEGMVNSAPIGRYVVIARFAETATIVADRFIARDEDRNDLQHAIDALPLEGGVADLDELEHHVLDWREAASKAFAPRQVRFKVDVLTDGAAVSATSERSLDILAGRRTKRTDLGDGLRVYSLTFSDTASAVEAPVPDNAASSTTIVVAAVVALAAAAVVLLVRARGRMRRRTRRSNLTETFESSDPSQVPSAIVATELAIDARGAGTTVQGPSEVAYLAGIPIDFGTDGASAFPLHAGSRAPGRLLSITLDGRGGAVLTNLAVGLTIDGRPAAEGQGIDPMSPHVFAAGGVAVRIRPADASRADTRSYPSISAPNGKETPARPRGVRPEIRSQSENPIVNAR